MAVWGTNFVVIAFALEHLPPLLLAALRFTLVFVPMALFVKRPNVPLSNLAAYGVLIGAGQFGLLFLAMKNDITPGLASLVVQSQIFFTIGLSMRTSGERVQTHQWAALALATSGIALIFVNTEGGTTPAWAWADARRGAVLGARQHHRAQSRRRGDAAVHCVVERVRGAAAVCAGLPV